MIRVVNKKTCRDNGVYIGRPSPLGNPFSHLPRSQAEIRVATREEAIERYRGWIRGQLGTGSPADLMFQELVGFYRAYGELVLVCWCKPEACHGDILAEMIEDAK